MTTPPISAIPLTMNPIVTAIASLYRVASGIHDFIDSHIDQMKKNASATVRAAGNVLEGAKFGFGIGYITPLVIIAVGQFILGNPLSAAATVVTAPLLVNPLAMTCGAIGAIYYGWNALSEVERASIVNRIIEAFQVGAELIKSVVTFVLTSLGSLLSSENRAEFKKTVADIAHGFGKSLSDVTHSVRDRLTDTAVAVADAVGMTADLAVDGVATAAASARKNIGVVASVVSDTADSTTRFVRDATRRNR